MKKIIYVFISLCLLFLIPGCKRYIRLKDGPFSIENTDKIGNYLKKYDTSFNDVTYKKLLDDAIEKIKGIDNYADLEEAIYDVYYKTNELVKKYYIATALYNYDSSNEEYKNNKDILTDAYYEYEQFRANLIYEISDSDEMLQLFFAGYSDEDIEFEVNLAKKKKEDTYINLQKEINDISDEFDKLNFDFKDKTNESEIAEVLYRFVNKNNELSTYLGFNSYIEYKDIEYARIYTADEVNDFINNVKKYIIPLMDSERTVIDLSKKIRKLSNAEYNYLIEFDESSVFDSDYKTLNLANDYAKKIGGKYYQTYRDYRNNGYYIYANKTTSLDTAYSNPYLTYFGANYQSVDDLIHEFGHFYSFNNDLLTYKSLDLKEFFSQGNEFLFMSYLEQYSYKNVLNVYDVLATNKIDTACLTMLVGSALREFEQDLYTKTLTGPADIIALWDNIKGEYNNLLEEYWKFEIRYDVYYLSYATSVTGALSLYTNSKTNFNSAVNSYVKAANNENIDDDLEEVLVKNGLTSPFKEETFIAIKELIYEKRK